MNTVPAVAAKKTNRSKVTRRITLDIALILVMITLYSKNVFSLWYHEVVGLVLFALFAVHLLMNRQWIGNLFRNMAGNGTIRKPLAVIDGLLVLSWTVVMITGILVSKKVFGLRVSALNPFHFFSAAMALIVTGIHFGLHWQYFWGFFGKRIRMPRTLAALLMTAVILFGGWQTVNSSFSRWITAPFRSSAGERPMAEAGMMMGDAGAAERPSGSEAAAPSGENADGQQVMPGHGAENGQGKPSFSLLNLLNVVATYFSIAFLFAAITRGLELLIRRMRSVQKNDGKDPESFPV